MPQQTLSDLELLTLAAIEGGAMARHFLREGFTQERHKLEGDPFLTNADHAIDTRLKEVLLAARPDYGWLSEETAADLSQLHKEFVFVVDPIDGTRAFIERGDNFGVSVGLLHRGKPVLGAVYRPVEHQLIAGGPKLGVFLNGQPALPGPQPEKPRVMVGYREENKGRFDHYRQAFTVAVEGSIAYRYAMVGAGLAELAVSYHEMRLWDVCAGHAIALAGGANTCYLATGEGYDYTSGNLIIAPGTLCAGQHALDRYRQVFNHPPRSAKL